MLVERAKAQRLDARGEDKLPEGFTVFRFRVVAAHDLLKARTDESDRRHTQAPFGHLANEVGTPLKQSCE